MFSKIYPWFRNVMSVCREVLDLSCIDPLNSWVFHACHLETLVCLFSFLPKNQPDSSYWKRLSSITSSNILFFVVHSELIAGCAITTKQKILLYCILIIISSLILFSTQFPFSLLLKEIQKGPLFFCHSYNFTLSANTIVIQK